MKIVLSSLLLLSASAFAGGGDKHKPLFDKLMKAYESTTATAVKPESFTAREQVWLGECVSTFHLPELEYHRDEYYLPVIRRKTAPGEPLKVQFSAIDVGGDPYSSKNIDEPKDAIWYLRGEAGSRISLARVSEKHKALVADYYGEGLIALKQGILEGSTVYLYQHTDAKEGVVSVCYFDEKVL